MDASVFYQSLKKSDFTPFIGVPCSILSPFLKVLDKQNELLIATSEGEAMGIASGMYLAGKNPVVFMQNSGLCNAFNPLTSLNLIYGIPLLLLITLRGEPGMNDASQHSFMGEKTKDFLKLLNIEYRYVTGDIKRFNKDLLDIKKKLKKNLKPIAFLLQQGIFDKEANVKEIVDVTSNTITREIAIDEIARALNNHCLVVTTTGKITREYYSCKNRRSNKNFYMVGSMGCASAIGLGLTLGTRKAKKVVVVDGDGAVLMKMGNLATIGNRKPKDLIHIVLDNQCHESTGGQATSSTTAALDKIARSCGYLRTFRITNSGQIKRIVKEALNIRGPSFILVKITETNKDNLGRPKEEPCQIKEQFIESIKE
ncbi:phosphonopyruvate decarboxylase [Candidatus Omnitrophota bacterium]